MTSEDDELPPGLSQEQLWEEKKRMLRWKEVVEEVSRLYSGQHPGIVLAVLRRKLESLEADEHMQQWAQDISQGKKLSFNLSFDPNELNDR